MIKDVHTGHCCVLPGHGCKYSDEGCTVVTRKALQEYPCEDCSIEEMTSKPLRDLIDQHIKQAYDSSGHVMPTHPDDHRRYEDSAREVQALQRLKDDMIKRGLLFSSPKLQ